jgi:hypothetical protein
MLNTPILFLIFNRPDTTKLVFETIKKAQPTRLYIAADGARNYKENEETICLQTKELVLKNIDWKCEVKTLFRTQNLGCKQAVSEAINWFFENEEQGIILEDDCLPEMSFFKFCEQMLEYYKNDAKVFHIGGNNLQNGQKRGDASYYFSHLNHIWGWATWKRAWKNYDIELKNWDSFKKSGGMNSIFHDREVRNYYKKHIDELIEKQVDTWDLQWTASMWMGGGIAILPNVNLIQNIGFGAEATHTTNPNNKLANLSTKPIEFPLVHPINAQILNEADHFSYYYYFKIPFLRKIRKILVRVKRKLLDLYVQNIQL